ncbi:MAG: C-terminal binding protein [Defluviitaleaceae bacterium]|nr:C-terminal binding protein [Defluviitaleaceae bacterium]
MSNPKIIVCECDHADLKQEHEVFTAAGIDYKFIPCTSPDEVIEKCQGGEVMLKQYIVFDEHIFKNVPTLKCIVQYGVGTNNINFEDAAKYGVQVTNVPDYGMNDVADHTLALMMNIVRKVNYLNKRVHEGVWSVKEVAPIHRISEMTIGVIGLGRIGSAFAHRARALGGKIIGYDKGYGVPGLQFPDYIQYKGSVEELLAEADIVSLHCALDKSTMNLMNKERFAIMKDGAYLLNTARGGLIDEAALYDALVCNKLAGVGLDVTAQEPIPNDHPLLTLDNVIVTPHSSWYSVEAYQDLKRKAAEDAVNFVSGRPVRYPVNTLNK